MNSAYNTAKKLAAPFLVCALAVSAFAARSVEEFKTSAGTLKITTVMHAGFLIEASGQVVVVEPRGIQAAL